MIRYDGIVEGSQTAKEAILKEWIVLKFEKLSQRKPFGAPHSYQIALTGVCLRFLSFNIFLLEDFWTLGTSMETKEAC